MHHPAVPVKVTEERMTGILCQLSWQNDHVQDALWSLFTPRERERLVEIRVTQQGLTARFE